MLLGAHNRNFCGCSTAFDSHPCLISHLRVVFCAPRTWLNTISDSCSMMFDAVLYDDVLSCRRAFKNNLRLISSAENKFFVAKTFIFTFNFQVNSQLFSPNNSKII